MPRKGRETTPSSGTTPGSLTQAGSGYLTACHACASTRVTRIAMRLTDGTPVDFTSCHACESRSWEADGMPLAVDEVLLRARKPR
ncbi:MAG: hypothetical protein ACRDYU_19295 [Actinomycetes bacterium]